MPIPAELEFFMDPSRCIGCEACVQACSECDTHKGTAMIHLEYTNRAESPQTAPIICMHCDSPTCAEVCPADAIKKTEDGVVQSAKKERCIGCNNCGLACPFGVPKVEVTGIELMMKCDMCYDRTSEGRKPLCASVCPSQCLYFGTREEIAALRPNSRPINQFQFGHQEINTKVNMLLPIEDSDSTLNVTASTGAQSIDDMMMEGLYGKTVL